MALVELHRVSKRFNDTEIIKGVDLTIRDRELTVLVGPSGCGKSTLLRLIAGLEGISSGDLLIDGVRVNDLPPAKRGLALVFQSYALYPHMTVAENMSFSLKLAGVAKAAREKKVLDAAAILHLEPLLERKPKDLSGGQRQRVAIGRAIVRNPKIFLFDEPLSNLDAALRVRMRLELTKLHRQLQSTMIYVTHDQVEAMTMADRIVVLNAGMVEQVGTPMELYQSPRNIFVAGFIGSPRMNFFAATVAGLDSSGTTFSLTGCVVHVSWRVDPLQIGEVVTLGIRPEHILFVESGGIPAEIQVVEHLGSESYLHVQTAAGEAATVRVNGVTRATPDQRVQLGIDATQMHVFAENGMRISSLSKLLAMASQLKYDPRRGTNACSASVSALLLAATPSLRMRRRLASSLPCRSQVVSGIC